MCIWKSKILKVLAQKIYISITVAFFLTTIYNILKCEESAPNVQGHIWISNVSCRKYFKIMSTLYITIAALIENVTDKCYY